MEQPKRPAGGMNLAGPKRSNYCVDPVKTGRRLWFLTNYRGYTVKEVAQFLGMENPQGVYHWFHGRNCPSLDNLYALGELFGVPLGQMVCGNRRDLMTMANRILCYASLISWNSQGMREDVKRGRKRKL